METSNPKRSEEGVLGSRSAGKGGPAKDGHRLAKSTHSGESFEDWGGGLLTAVCTERKEGLGLEYNCFNL